jgi:hypothetical protein
MIMYALPSVESLILGVVKVVIDGDVWEGGGHQELALTLLDVKEHLDKAQLLVLTLAGREA